MRTITRRILAAAKIDPLTIDLHDGTQITTTDLHAYRGDFFRENADFYFGHICGMKEGEICYLLGDSAPTTLDRHYLDYTYDLMQYRMMIAMRRWLCRYDDRIGLPSAEPSAVGIKPLTGDVRLISDGRHPVTAQILLPDGGAAGCGITVRAPHGIRWSCTVGKEQKNDDR